MLFEMRLASHFVGFLLLGWMLLQENESSSHHGDKNKKEEEEEEEEEEKKKRRSRSRSQKNDARINKKTKDSETGGRTRNPKRKGY